MKYHFSTYSIYAMNALLSTKLNNIMLLWD